MESCGLGLATMFVLLVIPMVIYMCTLEKPCHSFPMMMRRYNEDQEMVHVVMVGMLRSYEIEVYLPTYAVK